jgi:hypothetical protein
MGLRLRALREPVATYHGLARRYRQPLRLLVSAQLNIGRLDRPVWSTSASENQS